MAKGTRGGKRVYIRKDGTWKGMEAETPAWKASDYVSLGDAEYNFNDYVLTVHDPSSRYKSWIAELTGVGGKYGLIREFFDESEYLSRGGSYFNVKLREGGIYELNQGGGRNARGYRVVQDGKLYRLNKSMAKTLLYNLPKPPIQTKGKRR